LSTVSLLAACGGGEGGSGYRASIDDTTSTAPGLPDSYTPPRSTYTAPTAEDPNRFALREPEVDPYWVAALRNPEFDRLAAMVEEVDRTIGYAFPETQPAYYDATMGPNGWQPATPAMKAATWEILARLETVINARFEETADIEATNVIVVSRTDMASDTLGYAYYPSTVSFLGSDVLISPLYAAPEQGADGLTNLDYELLVHELGHALGLKHPFEAMGSSTTTLNATEDTTVWTALSYDAPPSSFDGAFRALDLMALTEAYGVDPSYRAGDDIYTFSSQQGVFVIDGGGSDAISALGQARGVTLDLREGQQSFIGATSDLVSAPRQLAISANTEIEMAIGGAGDDRLIGNGLDNRLEGGAGVDRIFAGEGADTVAGGPGSDIIDLSEVVSSLDTVVLDPDEAGADLVYGFEQGVGGDVIEVVGAAVESLLDVVSADRVPEAFVQGHVLRLTDAVLETAAQVETAFADGGAFEALEITAGGAVIVITAASQATGETQTLFHFETGADGLQAAQLAQLEGNALDIDSWQAGNFV
jgi:serralysin